MKYYKARHFLPVFNTPHLSSVYRKTLELDQKHLLRILEFVAFPHTLFCLQKKVNSNFACVTTEEYPSSAPLYVLWDHIQPISKPQKRTKALPPLETMVARLKSLLNVPYVWGGNYPLGFPEFFMRYPPKNRLSLIEQYSWIFQGLDCSGLLYYVTDGYTPRNTSGLMHFGKSIPIEGCTFSEIQKYIQPLDILVYQETTSSRKEGHVLIALDAHKWIEANLQNRKVVITDCIQRVQAIFKSEPIPLNPWIQKEKTLHFRLNRFVNI